jgi:Zn-dependent M28 family amino/carboxypeptidase
MRIILSVGTLKGSESMKDLVSAQNLIQEKPFQLDLWQSDENGDSDYTPFAKKEIPVMTFFSGFHDDYHTPRDVIQKVDFEKMKNVLNIVNGCINDHLAGLKGKE